MGYTSYDEETAQYCMIAYSNLLGIGMFKVRGPAQLGYANASRFASDRGIGEKYGARKNMQYGFCCVVFGGRERAFMLCVDGNVHPARTAFSYPPSLY